MKTKTITVVFLIFFISITVINIAMPEREISYSERRKLARLPTLSWQDVLSGKYMDDFEKYALDQFVLRDKFRAIKAYFELKVFRKLDNNDIYIIGDNLFKMEYPFRPDNVYRVVEHLKAVYDLYLEDMNVYYSLIPDKNYFVADQHGYLSIDYDELEKIMVENLEHMTYIDIFDSLTIDDYYKTDVHWRQERLRDVIVEMAQVMCFSHNPRDIEYSSREYYPFYGAYYGQSALKVEPDTLTYNLSQTIDNAIVKNYDSRDDMSKPLGVYDEKMLGMIDSYDVFLSGATPLIQVLNPMNVSGRELIIFRDSFGSSLAPLLLEEYSKITLVDLRYMSYRDLGKFIDFDNQDILFLYNTLLVNNGNILK